MWRSAAMAIGVPLSSKPWLLSWTNLLEERKAGGRRSSTVTCQLYNLLDVNKAYDVSFPQHHFVACCGASHGWLVLVNELFNLVLYNPFTLARIPLPPITDFSCVEAVYDSKGNLQHYLFEGKRVDDKIPLGTWFYEKAVLSCSPSKGGDYVVMILHSDARWLSFVREGQNMWRVASTLPGRGGNRYVDCAYHNGRFYAVTLDGLVEKWDLDELNGPTREIVVASGHPGRILTRHLVSTPWGDLLHVRLMFAPECPDGIRFQIRRVDSDGCKGVVRKNLVCHTLLLGLNHSACLPTKSFLGLQPQCIYFSSPWMTGTSDWIFKIRRGWGGVRMYDLQTRKFEHAFPLCDRRGLINPPPSEVWITPNL